MHVVKIGGSFARDPRLPGWLACLAAQPAERGIVVVPGGGPFADAARVAQTYWHLDDLAAHNLAVLGMAQFAHVLHGLCPALRVASSYAALRATVARGQHAIWLPTALQRTRPGALTNWDTTSDSLAAHLARALPAQRLTVFKACAVAPGVSFAALAQAGIVDAAFPAQAAACVAQGIRVEVVSLAADEALRTLCEAVGAPGEDGNSKEVRFWKVK